MTLRRPLWQQVTTAEGGYPALLDRQLIAALLAEGVIGLLDLKVSQKAAGANYSVDVSAGSAAIVGDATSGQGTYIVVSTATENLIPTPVPSPGNSRIDVVIAEVRDHTEDGSGFKDWRLRIVAGTPAGSPVAPPVPSTAIALGQFTVTNATTSIITGGITDRRSFARPTTQRFEVIYNTVDVTAANLNGGSGSPIMQQVVPAQGFPYRLDVDAAFGYNIVAPASTSYISGQIHDGASLVRESTDFWDAGAGAVSATLTIAPISILVPGGGAKTINVSASEVGSPSVTLLDEGTFPQVGFLRCVVVPTG